MPTTCKSQLRSRDGVVVRALSSHQCGSGSIPGVGAICGLCLLLALIAASTDFLRFPPLHNNQRFQIPIRPGNSQPFKDQSSANIVKRRLSKLSLKVGTAIQPVFVSRKLNEDLKVQEAKPSIVNQQCVVYKFKCNLCDAGYVRYTRGYLYGRVDGHKRKSSSICKHYHLQHNDRIPQRVLEQFHVLAKCTNKFDCLIHEMLFIRKLKPELNVQTDSICA